MLCRINPTVGGATDEKARAINFLRALQAICTAAANTTPSVPSQTTATATPSGTDVILEVISNSEAGGWSNSASTNVTSNYNASFGSPYQLDLYRDSGKGAFPYRKMSFRTNPYQTFSGSYTSYPLIVASHGFNTATDASGNYLLGTSMTMPADNGVTNQYRFDVNYMSADGNAYGSYHPFFKPAAGEYLVASTSQYFIIMSGSLGATGNPGTMVYIGLRTTNSWENQYDDNPPLVSVCYDGSQYYSNSSGSNASMWCRTFQSNGQVNSNPAWFRINNEGYNSFSNTPDIYGRYVDPLSGYLNFVNYGTQYMGNISNDARYYYGNEMQVPMLPGFTTVMRSKARTGQFAVVPPVSDLATGTFVPPALPITFARNRQASMNPGGTAIGLYKSLGGSDTYMQQYYTPGQTFIINGEAFYPYAIGNDTNYRDLFLVRKA